jgi:hypothetical protein
MKRTLCIAAMLVTLTGCEAMDSLLNRSLSPEAQATLQAYEESLADWDQAIDKAELDIKALAEEAREQAEAADWMGAQITLAKLDQRQEQHKLLTEQYTRIAQQERGIIEKHLSGGVHGILALLDPLIPVPLQPLMPFASTLLVMLFSKRGRMHTKNAARHTLVGNLGQTAKDLLKAAGAKHTQDQPETPEAPEA